MASRVMAGCSSAQRLRRLRVMAMNAHATMTAQPKCNDGIAANWLATDCVVSAL